MARMPGWYGSKVSVTTWKSLEHWMIGMGSLFQKNHTQWDLSLTLIGWVPTKREQSINWIDQAEEVTAILV
jgi:hypothetical protein